MTPSDIQALENLVDKWHDQCKGRINKDAVDAINHFDNNFPTEFSPLFCAARQVGQLDCAIELQRLIKELRDSYSSAA